MLACCSAFLAASLSLLQARAEQLSEHEDSLDAWKQHFRAEALRQIGEREDGLNEWQATLSRRQQELEDMQLSMEVRYAGSAKALLSGLVDVP